MYEIMREKLGVTEELPAAAKSEKKSDESEKQPDGEDEASSDKSEL